MGPIQINGPFFELYYEPTEEQIKNFRALGWNYATEEEVNKLIREHEKTLPQYNPMFNE